MKKILTLFLFLLPVVTYATGGACSYHNGVNCRVGATYTGRVQCNDGWINSSVYFSDVEECKVHQVTTCVYPSEWSGCKNESDYSRMESQISLSQIRTGTSFNSENNAQALKDCRDAINSYSAIISQYNQCMIRDYSYNPVIEKVVDTQKEKVNQARKVFIDEAFKKHFTLAVNDMPEYKNIVDPNVIKELSLKPENSNKTFPQLITETYSNKLPVRAISISASTSTPPQNITKVSFSRNLKKGISGDDVKQLQMLLQKLNYLPNDHSPSKYFGVITNSALIKFQKDNKIQPASGLFGPTTQAKLISLTK